MPKITFIVDHTPDGQAPNRPTYKAGETYDLERSYAEKYVRRGWAKPYETPAPPPSRNFTKPEPASDTVNEDRSDEMSTTFTSNRGRRR